MYEDGTAFTYTNWVNEDWDSGAIYVAVKRSLGYKWENVSIYNTGLGFLCEMNL